MPEQPMMLYRTLDPEFAGLVHEAGELALADGALPRKTKLLIAMLFDAEMARRRESRRWHGRHCRQAPPDRKSWRR